MTYFEHKKYIIILALHNPNSFPEGRFYLLLKSLQMSEIFSLMGQSLWGAIFYNSVFETAFLSRVGMCEIGENEYELTADRASSRINNVCHKSFSRPKAVNGGSSQVGVKRILEYAAAQEKQAVFHTGNPKSKRRASDAFFFLQK